jgi:hypothetical protein
MVTLTLDDAALKSIPHGHGMEKSAEPRDLVEWEMSAAQVGSLVTALALIFGAVWLIG